MSEDLIGTKKVAFFVGCFTNYYYSRAGKATVKVLQKNGIEVVVPKQVCCGLPMMAKENTQGAYKNMSYNTKVFSKLVSDGYTIITSCSSCGLMIKKDYSLVLRSEEAKLISEHMFHITEYLIKLLEVGELKTNFQLNSQTVFYHNPCHLRAQEIDNPTIKMLKLIPGITIKYVSNECCGMGGAYGYEKLNYRLSKEIAEKLYSEIRATPTDRIVTDCGGCKLQIEAGARVRVDHPIILVKEAYSL